MSDADTKLLERAIDEASRKKSHYYYSAALEARVVAASEATHTITIEFTAVDSISSAGYLDEGFVGTVADYWTSVLISAVNQGRQSVTTTLTVQTLGRIVHGEKVHVICTTKANDGVPGATAVFASADDRRIVYAVVVHTKFFKALRQ